MFFFKSGIEEVEAKKLGAMGAEAMEVVGAEAIEAGAMGAVGAGAFVQTEFRNPLLTSSRSSKL